VPTELIDFLPSAEGIEKRVRLEFDLENDGKKTAKDKKRTQLKRQHSWKRQAGKQQQNQGKQRLPFPPFARFY
jgi:hypothetical protein